MAIGRLDARGAGLDHHLAGPSLRPDVRRRPRFAPDARSVVVSPGTDVFVLDAATGAVRASNNAGAAVLDVAYGLDGSRDRRRAAFPGRALQSRPNGGTVGPVRRQPVSWWRRSPILGSYPGARGIPAFRASPTADLVLVAPGAEHPPGLRRVQAQRRRRRARARPGDAAAGLHARRQEHARECWGRRSSASAPTMCRSRRW